MRGKQTPVTTFNEDTNGVLPKHQKEHPKLLKKILCQLLHPVTVQQLEASNKQIGEEIYLTEAKVSTAIKSLKAGKASGENNIRPEMLRL